MADNIYRRDDDKKRAKRSMPITIAYLLLLLLGMGITGFLLENSSLKKWNPADTGYKTNKAGIISFLLCVILYGLMCIV